MQEKGRDGGSAAGSNLAPEDAKIFASRFGKTWDLEAAQADLVLELDRRDAEVSDRSDTSLIRDLRDVGTGKIKHVFAGTCPEVWEAGIETTNDRADPGDKCEACDVLRRADAVLGKVSDRSDTSDRWVVGDEDCPPALKLLDEFREEMLRFIPQRFDEQRVILDTKLLKLREMVREMEEDLEASIEKIQ